MYNLGKGAKTLSVGRKLDEYTGVRILVGQNDSGEEVEYFVGDETGYVLEIENPFGTPMTAATILAGLKLRNSRYQPFDAGGAFIDPAVEIGDGVEVDGTQSVILSTQTTFGRLMAADISAPYDEEVDHEFPYESKTQREFKRESATTRARLSIDEDSIEAKVEKVGNDGSSESFRWELLSDSHTWYANNAEVMRVTKGGLKVSGEVVATSGVIGGCQIVNGLLQVEGASIRNLNADYITAGTLSVDRIMAGSITGGSDGKIANETLTTYNTSSGINTNLGYAAGYGYVTNNQNPSTNYPSYFKAGHVWANALTVNGYGFVRGTSFVYNGVTHYPWEYQA